MNAPTHDAEVVFRGVLPSDALLATVREQDTLLSSYPGTLGGKTVQLKGHPASFTVNLRRRGARVKVAAVDASGRVLTKAQRKVTKLRKGKRGVGSGGGVGT